ncbi:hypothetical protein ACIBG8_08470 [Nonomuraea sp. NPDC050556]
MTANIDVLQTLASGTREHGRWPQTPTCTVSCTTSCMPLTCDSTF